MDWWFIVIWIALPVLAGYIAHTKGRSWITATVLTLCAPPVGIVSVLLQSPHPNCGLPTNTKAKVLLGLLPLWVSIFVLIGGSFSSGSAEYWNVAPWIVIIAIPACAVTLGLVEVASRWKRRQEKD